jgi:hypothetical protein
VDRQSIATADLPGTGSEAVSRDVTVILRDSSMRILEAALAIGALATALLLGLVR